MRFVKVYIAGPYSKGDVDYNTEVAMRMWSTLWALGYIPYCPHWTHFQHKLDPLPYDDWLEFDSYWLDDCDAVIRLPGESGGADDEVAAANTLHIPVYYSVDELVEKKPVNGKPTTREDSPA